MTKKKTAAPRPVSEVEEAVERVLSHAESQGEVYPGAVSDHATIRAAMTDAASELHTSGSGDDATKGEPESAKPE